MIEHESHQLAWNRVSKHALEVSKTLKQQGFQAFLVGGCVRDLLLGKTPKDFDVSTNATPQQVRSLFRRSRLVGKRFQIVHVRFGRSELVEVSTFRKSAISQNTGDEIRHSDEGLILRDNLFGTIEEDAFRRDFTINALYYDPSTKRIFDYVGALADLYNRELRCIGDPSIRLREDPVRALRAIRFQAKLGLTLHSSIRAELPLMAALILSVPPARLFDQMQKMFLSGYGENMWLLLKKTPFLKILFPFTSSDNNLIQKAIRNTDQRVEKDKPITIGFILAALLWEDYSARVVALKEHKKIREARSIAAIETIQDQQKIISIPRRFSAFITEVWLLQPRLEERRKLDINRLFNHRRFRAAYDFLLLRKQSGETGVTDESADWWTKFQESNSVREKIKRPADKKKAKPNNKQS